MPLHHLFDIAARYAGNLVLAVADDKPGFKIRGTAYIFDLGSRTQLRRFSLRYERPGWRLALSRDDRFCFAGCYNSYGLAAYNCVTGEEAWRRKDLKSVQAVEASHFEDFVFCGRETGAAHLVEATTGDTMEKLTGVKEIYTSPFDRSIIVAGRALDLHRPFGRRLASFKRLSRFELPCAFSPSEFVLNEPCLLRCYDLNSHELLWSYSAPDGKHIQRVWYRESSASFVGETKSGLLVFDARTGRISGEIMLVSQTGYVFGVCRRGSEIFAANLQLLSTETGALLADLATPELLAWDPEARMERLKELAASGRSPEELERYMSSEGFARNHINVVMLMKYANDRKRAT